MGSASRGGLPNPPGLPTGGLSTGGLHPGGLHPEGVCLVVGGLHSGGSAQPPRSAYRGVWQTPSPL